MRSAIPEPSRRFPPPRAPKIQPVTLASSGLVFISNFQAHQFATRQHWRGCAGRVGRGHVASNPLASCNRACQTPSVYQAMHMRRLITVNDRMQRGYRYELVEPVGRNFDLEFKPDLTPAEMLCLGVFGGKYMTDCGDEFPASWFKHARLASGSRDNSLNYFGVEASQPLSEWRRKGWIHPDDPRGWFQWYCRYYVGRRMPDEDVRQVKRWKAIRRHVRQLQLACEPGDLSCRRRQRQALLHWAYDSRKL